MRIVQNNKRISVLGLIKFLAAIAIVYFHISTRDHWEHLWLLVELFFFITGYFTFKHFRKKENRGKSGINLETLRKNGGVAQLGEHLPCTQGVRSSILLISTTGREGNDGQPTITGNGLIAQVVRAHA